MTDILHLRDHGEAVAHFRHALIGAFWRATCRTANWPPPCALFPRSAIDPGFRRHAQLFGAHPGALAVRVSLRRMQPCDRGPLRSRSWTTARRRASHAALRHPSRAPRRLGPLILRTLEADGRIERGKVSASTVRKLLREQGLDRVACATARDQDPIALANCASDASGKATSATDHPHARRPTYPRTHPRFDRRLFAISRRSRSPPDRARERHARSPGARYTHSRQTRYLIPR